MFKREINKKRILVVGQTPPPYHGQAVMIETIINSQFKNVELFHVRMSFSQDINEVGKFKLGKVIHLLKIILKIYFLKISKGCTILYYPPAGAHKVPVYRDFIILISTRWMFKKIVFHFHAGGISDIFSNLNNFEQFLFKKAYFFPDLTISLSKFVPQDSTFIKSINDIIIPYGITDKYDSSLRKRVDNKIIILFVGLLKESKGELILLDACNDLKKDGFTNFELQIAGDFDSDNYKEVFLAKVNEYSLTNNFKYLGVVKGYEKSEIFANADIFCFPTFYEFETFGIVNIEAMQFKLPVISTNWRGIQDIVENDKTGFIVNPKNKIELYEKLKILCQDKNLRNKFGEAGRLKYLSHYKKENYIQNISNAFNHLFN